MIIRPDLFKFFDSFSEKNSYVNERKAINHLLTDMHVDFQKHVLDHRKGKIDPLNADLKKEIFSANIYLAERALELGYLNI